MLDTWCESEPSEKQDTDLPTAEHHLLEESAL